jgi:hypothetical protein
MAELKFKTIGEQESRRLLEKYVALDQPFGWPLYDQDPTPDVLVGVDLAAPALLSYPIKSKYLDQMGRKSDEATANPYNTLLRKLSEFVSAPVISSFQSISADQISALANRESGSVIDGPPDFGLLIECLDAATPCKGIRSVAVTKILHRKRPDLVPINDSRVRKFYRVENSYAPLFGAIHRDLQDPETLELLKSLAKPHVGIDDRPMSILRALDIVIWMYMA